MLEDPKPEYWKHFQPPHTTPAEDGWYPVIRVFDPEGDGHPDSAQWHSGAWVTHQAHCVVFFGPRCEMEEQAIMAAIENDPEW